ncbi:MAG: hypothetical protein RBT86_01035 [Azospira sp.]|jgi:hypothetical protein|nr:hypothetical protein [Azospira sp.]
MHFCPVFPDSGKNARRIPAPRIPAFSAPALPALSGLLEAPREETMSFPLRRASEKDISDRVRGSGKQDARQNRSVQSMYAVRAGNFGKSVKGVS